MAVVAPVHRRRVLFGCPVCGKRHSRLEVVESTRINAIDDGGRLLTVVKARTLPRLRVDEIDNLRRQLRLHSPHSSDATRRVHPLCDRPQPCRLGRDAEARLLEAGVEPWHPR